VKASPRMLTKMLKVSPMGGTSDDDNALGKSDDKTPVDTNGRSEFVASKSDVN
jgi:hypothetical protein